ncbi:hypothetical protein FQR65_LT07606 [Abscondita terminalis]|nr:hypothetical protein FQR65_LT07606 [Abscondita terminalis]
MLKNLICGPSGFSIRFKYFGKYLFDCLNQRNSTEVIAINALTKETLTCGDLLRKSINLATSLKSLTVNKGDVIALISENNFHCYTVACGTLFCGATLHPVNYAYSLDELRYVFKLSKPKVVFTSVTSIDKVFTINKEIECIQEIISLEDNDEFKGISLKQLTENGHDDFEPAVGCPTDTAFLNLSSGTTGLPKCVEISHENLIPITNHCYDNRFINIRENDVTVLLLPFFHLYGGIIHLCAVTHSLVVVQMPHFQPDLFLQAIEEYKATILFLVPTILQFLIQNPIVSKYNLTSIQSIIVGAAPFGKKSYQQALLKFKSCSIRQFYGSTEICGICTLQEPSDLSYNVGKVVSNVVVKIVNPDTKALLGPYEQGEICVKTLAVMKGYLNNLIETQKSIDDDGFYHTGDIGYYDEDKKFYIVDRLKEMIKYKGFQVAPAELEDLLMSNPGIKDCGVIGIDDELCGQLPLAYVALREDSKLTEQEIKAFVAEKISTHKQLRGGVRFVKEIPRNKSGKILRRKLIDPITNDKLTCGQLLNEGIKLAIALKRLSVQKGDVIALISENSFQCYLVSCAALYCGAIFQPLSYFYTKRELKHVFEISNPKIVFASKTAVRNVLEIKNEMNCIQNVILTKNDVTIAEESIDSLIKNVENNNAFEIVVGNATDTAILCLSSGTTGLPKCVELTHQNIVPVLNHVFDNDYFNITSRDVTALVLPFYHLYGFFLHLVAITDSLTLIIMKSFIPNLFLEVIEKYKLTKLYLVPTMSVQDIVVGAAPLTNDLYQKAVNKFTQCSIRQLYGSTEIGGLCTIQRSSNKFVTIGQVISNMSIKIIDIETKAILGAKEVGEICVKSASIMKGYFNNPAETENSFDEDGFYRTGDVGYYDQNKYFFVVGRIKELIKYKGFQVSPSELESLLTSYPGVKDSGVVGIEDEKCGQLPLAFVVREKGSKLTEEEIIQNSIMNENIISGPYKRYSVEFKSLGEHLYNCLKNGEEDLVLVIDSITKEKLTCGQLLDKSIKLAMVLKRMSVQKGDVIAFISENSLVCFIVTCAVLYCGAVLQPLSYYYTKRELKHAFEISNPKIVFTSKTSVRSVMQLKNEMNCIQNVILTENDAGESINSLIKNVKNKNTFELIVGKPLDTTLLCLSSGTTGLPKCVELSYQNILTLLNNSCNVDYFNVTSKDITILVLPSFHLYGLLLIFLSITNSLKTVVIKSFTPNLFLEVIENYKITKLFIVPTVLEFLVKAAHVFNYKSLQDILLGGSPISSDLYEKSLHKFSHCTIRQFYGSTEICGFCTIQKTSDKMHTIGQVVCNTRIKIVDTETKAILGPNEAGEVCVRSSSIMKGYFNNPTDTKNSFDEDGFYRTGDVGYYDENKYFFIVGRIKELIKYKGFQVAPSEIECLLLSYPGIKDCGVVGIEDERCGQLPLAFIVCEEGSKLTEEEIVKFVAENLSVQKHLHGGVRFIGEIPRNPTGKILRRELAKLIYKHKY